MYLDIFRGSISLYKYVFIKIVKGGKYKRIYSDLNSFGPINPFLKGPPLRKGLIAVVASWQKSNWVDSLKEIF